MRWLAVQLLVLWVLVAAGCGAVEPHRTRGRSVARVTGSALERRTPGYTEPSFCSRLHGMVALDDGDESSGSFPTSSVGWILFTPEALHEAGGDSVCNSMLRTTADGARSFRPVRTPAEPFTAVVASSAQDVWLIGRRSYVSENGGRRWRSVGLPSDVDELVLDGRVAMVIATSCDRGQCSQVLLRSIDGGQTWQHQALARDTSDALAARGRLVVVITGTRLLVSDDRGRGFVSQHSACKSVERPLIAIGPDRTIWELCAGQPSAGSQEKLVFRSGDLGRHWAIASTWTSQSPPSPLDVGYAGSLAAPGDATLVLTQARGGLLVSDDGGHRWTTAIPDINDADPAPGWLSFPTPTRGYAWIYEDHIFSTSDGGRTWHQVPIRALG